MHDLSKSLLLCVSPPMKKRIIDIRLFAVLAILCAGASAHAANLRETPLVRAVKRAKTSVVNIHSQKTTYENDALFAGKGRKVNGMGTGIIFDERGYIVTNFHVVNGVDSLRVTLEDGSTYTAEVIASDSKRDLAIIKIKTSRRLTVMPMGTSSDLMLGETVFAVGNAYGYEHTVTSGIISSLSRDVEVNEDQSYENLIQTDASINPGNSGGPLLSLTGEVVGINVAIRAGAQRIGFAIPIDDARRVIARLISVENRGRMVHGLVATDVKTTDRQMLVVDAAKPSSPAQAAGLQQGDVILKIGDTAVSDRVDFERALIGKTTQESIPLIVRRNNKKETLNIRLSNRHGYQVAQNKRSSKLNSSVMRGQSPSAEFEGVELELSPLSQKTWKVLGMRLKPVKKGDWLSKSDYNGGMQVVSVRKGGPAASNGIQEGDVLLGLHGWETATENDLSWIINHRKFATFKPLKFFILRSDETLYGYFRPELALNNEAK